MEAWTGDFRSTGDLCQVWDCLAALPIRGGILGTSTFSLDVSGELQGLAYLWTGSSSSQRVQALVIIVVVVAVTEVRVQLDRDGAVLGEPVALSR